jgi:hypothetical protein
MIFLFVFLKFAITSYIYISNFTKYTATSSNYKH